MELSQRLLRQITASTLAIPVRFFPVPFQQMQVSLAVPYATR